MISELWDFDDPKDASENILRMLAWQIDLPKGWLEDDLNRSMVFDFCWSCDDFSEVVELVRCDIDAA
jgi:hypothetical protein